MSRVAHTDGYFFFFFGSPLTVTKIQYLAPFSVVQRAMRVIPVLKPSATINWG
jgi:hypothetical protein